MQGNNNFCFLLLLSFSVAVSFFIIIVIIVYYYYFYCAFVSVVGFDLGDAAWQQKSSTLLALNEFVWFLQRCCDGNGDSDADCE